MISARPAHPALVSEADFIAAQHVTAPRGPARDPAGPGARRYLLAGLLACGSCGRKMEPAWSNGRAAYRCRHGHTTATGPDPGRLRNAYVRQDHILAKLPALHLMLTEPGSRRRRRTRGGIDARLQVSPEKMIRYLREQAVTLAYHQADGTLHATTPEAAQTITMKAS